MSTETQGNESKKKREPLGEAEIEDLERDLIKRALVVLQALDEDEQPLRAAIAARTASEIILSILDTTGDSTDRHGIVSQGASILLRRVHRDFIKTQKTLVIGSMKDITKMVAEQVLS